nr:hypothetical protein GCM10023233_27790 [Brevibacterium otitidis]
MPVPLYLSARRVEAGVLVDEILAADEARRAALTSFEEARAEQKSFSKQVAKEKDKDTKARLVAEAKGALHKPGCR